MKRIIALLSAVMLLLCGCGKKAEESKEKKPFFTESANGLSVEQFDIKVNGFDLKKLDIGEGFWISDTELAHTVGEDETRDEGTLVMSSLGIGSTAAEVIEKLGLKPGEVCFNYEYDPYGDGCTEIGDIIYDGTIPSVEKLSALDMALCIFYCYDNGEWKPIDQNTKSIEDFEYFFRVVFDAEGVHDLYGQEPGVVFSLELGICTN